MYINVSKPTAILTPVSCLYIGQYSSSKRYSILIQRWYS